MEQNLISGSVIDVLGGGRKLAKLLSKTTNTILNEKTVYSWKQQGVPDRWKPALVKLLVKNGLEVPESFLLPGMEIANFQITNSNNINSLYSSKDSSINEIEPE